MISDTRLNRLKDIKEKIQGSYSYFKDNCKRYNEFINFVFNTSLTTETRNKLAALQKPPIEFNILEAHISRLIGEFSKQEPGIEVRASDAVQTTDLTEEFIATLNIVEAHIREILCSSTNDSLNAKVMKDLLAGGFSVVEVYTDYLHENSFDQGIYVDRVFDPCLTGFDPLARDSHKGDGQYCFQLVPKTKEEFISEFGEDKLKDVKFERSIANSEEFNWSYKNQDQDIVIVCDYYEKCTKKARIVKLSNGKTMQKKDYKRLLEIWTELGFIEQAPIILDERWTNYTVIERYRLCGNCILEHIETDFTMLPLIFVDGNSVIVKQNDTNASVQMTRPYVYHAKGIQQLKNFSGQTVAAEIENMVQNKFKVALESIPEKYQDAYTNPQQAQVLVYNAFYKSNPDQPLPPPLEIQRTPTPTIVEATFAGSDSVTQAILGSYDGILGISGKQISGVAIQQGAMQSNAAAMPYLLGFIAGFNRIAQVIIELIPKFYVTPRSIPILNADGRRGYQIINDNKSKSSININYNPSDLQISIEAGVNSAVQKQVALDQIIKMMQSSALFAEFINTEGLETIIDNMDIRGVDQLKEKSISFMQKQQQIQAEQAQQGDPMTDVAREQVQAEFEASIAQTQMQREKAQGELAINTAKVAIEKQKADTSFMQAIAKIEAEKSKSVRDAQRFASEDAKDAVEIALDVAKQQFEMSKEVYNND